MNANPPRKRPSRNRRPRAVNVDRRRDLWRDVPAPTPPEPIAPAKNPGALLESLGPAPLPGRLVADQYLATVVERAAALATALAASADILAVTEDE